MRDWDFEGHLARTLRISFCLLVFLCLALVLRPKDPFIWGFLVGAGAGMWNAFFLGKRLRAILAMAVPKANAHLKTGYALRISIVIAVLFFVSRTESINIYATAAGFFLVPCIFTVGAALMLLGILRGSQERPNP